MHAADLLEVDLVDRWVGRGARKLQAALDTFAPSGLTVAGRHALDIGASTGGFTQVLLAYGARSVVALDVGHDQLAPAVATDPRVRELSGVNIRHAVPSEIGAPFDVVVADVSFVSLTVILPLLPSLLAPAADPRHAHPADAILLVKPQFEAGAKALGNSGVVRSAALQGAVLRDVLDCAHATGLALRGLIPSPMRGANGNVEYLGWWSTTRGPGPAVGLPVTAVVEAAVAGGRNTTERSGPDVADHGTPG